MRRLAAVILDQGSPEHTISCLGALVAQLDPATDAVVVVDDSERGSSSPPIDAALARLHLDGFATRLRADTGGNVAQGFEAGMGAVEAELYLLVGSDTRPLPGAVAALVDAAALHVDAGLIGPRMEYADGSTAPSCFRAANPATEFLRAAGTGILPPLTRWYELHIMPPDAPLEVDWVSFVAVLVRRSLRQRLGPLDPACAAGYEALDYGRRTQASGGKVLHWPAARFVYYRAAARRQAAATSGADGGRPRRPGGYYEARARYFEKHFGKTGLAAANAAFTLGHALGRARELVGRTPTRSFAGETLEIWRASRPRR